ncbi:hypothetical protein HY631_00090 [Candidatus Uhrbacteria bacterium]|nr:hypothetical protein [Candidatus Uhrbacteria bacterium]
MEERLTQIESEIASLKERNRRVEADKAWETSWFRVITIAGMTYFVAVLFMWSINVSRPWASALVPVIGFILSTLSLPAIKHWWIEKR